LVYLGLEKRGSANAGVWTMSEIDDLEDAVPNMKADSTCADRRCVTGRNRQLKSFAKGNENTRRLRESGDLLYLSTTPPTLPKLKFMGET
jgi:hypothetical protein